ncbi:hypothetical protein ACFSS9_16025 [Paenibacillus septentrionalis]
MIKGMGDSIDGALFPEEAWSKEHVSDMLGTVSIVGGGVAANIGKKTILNPVKPDLTPPKVPKVDPIPDQKTKTEGTGKNAVPEINPKYATAIDNKVTLKDQVELPSWLKETFTEGQYRTVVTNENIIVYRTFGGKAGENGAFATTVPAANRISSKIDSALLPEWKNSRQYEAVIEIPKGTELNIGKVEQQMTQTGTILQGGGDQILLPQNWPKEWIKEMREVPSR